MAETAKSRRSVGLSPIRKGHLPIRHRRLTDNCLAAKSKRIIRLGKASQPLERWRSALLESLLRWADEAEAQRG